MATYHRTQALGSGTFGSVLKVYNNSGEEFAMKLFLNDNDNDDETAAEEGGRNDTMNVGALLEISVLRLLREGNGHPNIVQMVDVCTADNACDDDGDDDYNGEEEVGGGGGGAGTSGCLGMTMPLYPLGSLDQAIQQSMPLLLQSRTNKIRVAHGLLSAINYLHENGIMHRDIKADNIMLTTNSHCSDRFAHDDDDNDPNIVIKPILIDFSLAKIVNSAMFNTTLPNTADDEFHSLRDDECPTSHTGQIGTATYMAPEVNACQPYNLRSDLWSTGVVLLELLQKNTLRAVKATQAEKLVQQGLEKLPMDKPFPTMVRNLVQKDPQNRWTARECLENMSSTLFASMTVPVKRIINIKGALPLDFGPDENKENNAPELDDTTNTMNGQTKTPRKKKSNNKKHNPVLVRRIQQLRKLLHQELESDHPMTIQAALFYCQCMQELDDQLDDLTKSQTMLDCALLAYKMCEVPVLDLNCINDTYKSFAKYDWNLDVYRDNEATIFMMTDHCLFPRQIIDINN